MYVEASGAGQLVAVQSNVAFANPSPTLVSVKLNLLNLDLTPTGMFTNVTIPANGQLNAPLKSLFVALPEDFRGFIDVVASAPVGVAALRSVNNKRGEILLTSSPTPTAR
jgi:hypothetical protein